MKEKNIVIVGGDIRAKFLNDSLKAENFNSKRVFGTIYENPSYAFEKISSADIIILPLPLSKDKIHIFAPECEKRLTIDELNKHIPKGAYIFGGGTHRIFENSENYTNMLEDEAMTLKNALATAEAALSIIIEKCGKTVFKSKICVLGYGRIAKQLCKYLVTMNADVTVCARNPSARCEAELSGCKTVDFENFKKVLNTSDIIVNTVPATLISKSELVDLKKDILIIDLASKPGGVDFSAAEKLEINAVSALSLPGKYSPESAAEYIKKLILDRLTEKGVFV